jgi:hypothetical protein
MKEEIKNNTAHNTSILKIDLCNDLQSLDKNKFKNGLIKYKIHNKNTKPYSLKSIKHPILKKTPLLFQDNVDNLPATLNNAKSLFRFFIKNGEHVYGRANDIVVIESCDHLVNVYLAFNDKLKKAVRTNTLKDFLSILPAEQFMRISRFCAINIQRLSGGSCKEQTFEFDFRFSIKLKHAVPNSTFNCIGK